MTRHTLLGLLVVPLMGALATGCPEPNHVELTAVTGAPPARTARLKNYTTPRSIELSRGVSMGLRCWDSCDGQCIAPQFLLGNPDLIEVRDAYFAGSAGWVITAKAAGTTTLTVETTCASRDYAVTVTNSP